MTTSYIVTESILEYSDHILPSTWKHSGTRWQHLSYLIRGSIPTYSDHILHCKRKHSGIVTTFYLVPDNIQVHGDNIYLTLYMEAFRHLVTKSYMEHENLHIFGIYTAPNLSNSYSNDMLAVKLSGFPDMHWRDLFTSTRRQVTHCYLVFKHFLQKGPCNSTHF